MEAQAIEIIEVETAVVQCCGNVPSSRHPLVSLHLNKDGEVTCPYCSAKYVAKEGADLSGGH